MSKQGETWLRGTTHYADGIPGLGALWARFREVLPEIVEHPEPSAAEALSVLVICALEAHDPEFRAAKHATYVLPGVR